MLTAETIGAISLGLLLFQGIATLILLSRLLKGPGRTPPLKPQNPSPELLGAVSVVVPTLNEVDRIDPALEGLTRQSYEVREIIVVDSNSQDGTREKVQAAARFDPRFRLITDDPLPPGWVGRPWALHNGFLHSSQKSEWILGIDADTQPQPGLVASIVQTAIKEGYDLLSLSPQFILKYPGEWWLQPALLMTLLYRFDSAGVKFQSPERVMANGQCFLARRQVLEQLGGYKSAARSFCDDVTLARYAAAAGYQVGFLDGAQVIKVRMYEGAAQTWQEWGRSLDLKDASTLPQLWSDLWLLFCTQALPIPLLLILPNLQQPYPSLTLMGAIGLNVFLLLIRIGLQLAIAPAYYPFHSFASFFFWFSPLADPLAVLRIFLSALQKPTSWRGRVY
ncbi:MAG: glycosyltransferase [Gomphosphaeria aponina SAG 52.96 = DSM 107014]|uniref:Glycosyltransferase n=1 Tax=Gomphosphaeria aponina SAG 52.96 = DSM 107014 TaxID=1521640 RepID=A0A941GQL2_9CHRO|nr:glycosyltransferase [Gomphosphaeria aponina SAG 52.96 = DSM 107014]